MALRKISELTAAAALDRTESIEVVQGGNSRRATVQAILNSDGSVLGQGAVGDGVTDDTAAIQSAANVGGRILVPTGDYLVSSSITLSANTVIDCMPGVTFTQSGTGAIFSASGSRVTNQSNTLASNAESGDTQIALSSGKGDNFVAGTWALLMSEAEMWTENNQKRAEIVQVESVAGDTITLAAPIEWDYNTSDTAQLQKLELVDGLEIRFGHFTQSAPLTSLSNLLAFQYCYKPQIVGSSGSNSARAFLAFFGCVGHEVNDVSAYDLLSSDSLSHLGYACNEAGANLGGVFDNVRTERVRHLYTTNQSTSVLPYGVPTGSVVSNSVALFSRASAFDTHEEASDITFDNCIGIGGGRACFQIRGHRVVINGGRATNFIGPAVYIPNSVGAEDVTVRGIESYNTNLGTDDLDNDWTINGAIHDGGARTTVENARIQKCGGQGIRAVQGATDPLYRNNRIIDPLRSANTTSLSRAAILSTASGLASFRVNDNEIVCSDTGMNYGVKLDNALITAFVDGNRVRGAQITDVLVNESQLTSGNQGPSLVSFGPQVEVTIDSDAITIPLGDDGIGAIYALRGESELNDDLDTITNAGSNVGNVLVLRTEGSETITLKHGTGNLLLSGAADASLDSTAKVLTMMRLDSNWIETSRNF